MKKERYDTLLRLLGLPPRYFLTNEALRRRMDEAADTVTVAIAFLLAEQIDLSIDQQPEQDGDTTIYSSPVSSVQAVNLPDTGIGMYGSTPPPDELYEKIEALRGNARDYNVILKILNTKRS